MGPTGFPGGQTKLNQELCMKKLLYLCALGLAAALPPSGPALAADHRDGDFVLADPSTDINDVYTWMSSDASKVYLAMTVFPAANATMSKFSTAALYVFHTASRASFGATTATPLDIICSFDQGQRISCWVGSANNFISGDASATTGLSNSAGTIKVFAGPRKDHFFFNLDGFNRARGLVRNGAGGLTFNGDGCPTAPAATLNTVAMALSQNAAGGTPAVDFFRNLNTLAIVLEIDKTLLNTGGAFISVWGGTHRKG